MADTLEDLAARCCERQNLRTIYRGPLGGVEECERCGFAYGYDGNGELTETTAAALRAIAKERG